MLGQLLIRKFQIKPYTYYVRLNKTNMLKQNTQLA